MVERQEPVKRMPRRSPWIRRAHAPRLVRAHLPETPFHAAQELLMFSQDVLPRPDFVVELLPRRIFFLRRHAAAMAQTTPALDASASRVPADP
jgi:hypothetical protein